MTNRLWEEVGGRCSVSYVVTVYLVTEGSKSAYFAAPASTGFFLFPGYLVELFFMKLFHHNLSILIYLNQLLLCNYTITIFNPI